MHRSRSRGRAGGRARARTESHDDRRHSMVRPQGGSVQTCPMSDVRVLAAAPEDAPWLREAVSPAEEARASRFRDPVDTARSLVASALLRHAVAGLQGLAPVEVTVGRWCRSCGGLADHGRPVALDSGTGLAAGVHLSAAHSGDVVLVAVTRAGAVGIDVECAASADFDGFDDAVLSERERGHVQALPPVARATWRARTWTRKEALLKATGHGLSVDPRGVDVLEPVGRWPDELAAALRPPSQAHFVDLPLSDSRHVATLAVLAVAAPSVLVDRLRPSA